MGAQGTIARYYKQASRMEANSPSISRKVVPEFPAFNTSALSAAAQSNTFNLHEFCI